MAGSDDRRVLCVWNREYVTGTGSEPWGIFKLEGIHGLLVRPEIGQQVFERIIYVINQRLQGLVIDGDFIHRVWPNGSHTCLAGRGTEARKLSIAYFEGGSGYAGMTSKAVMAVGPEHDFDVLQKAIESELKYFGPLVALANETIQHGRRRPLLEAPTFQDLRQSLEPTRSDSRHLADVNILTEYVADRLSPYETVHWSYDKWLESGTLNDAQRRVLESNALTRHPIRVIGPAGSGKTLLMQLLALQFLHDARASDRSLKVLYIVHNSAMGQTVIDRLRALGGEEFLTDARQSLVVSTLAEYGRRLINLSEINIIDKDASKTKEFQLEQVQLALRASLGAQQEVGKASNLLSQVAQNEELFEIFSQLVMAEISTVIKGRGLGDDEKRYTNSESPLSRLHGILTPIERSFVFDTFRRYHHVIFEEYAMLDSDDVALTLAGRLRTPLWNLKRREEGFDYVFIDEAQLFNENERRIFQYLTKGATNHVPIALALDEAQEPFGFSSAGLATLGITDIESESLPSNHRSTREIVDFAFFALQQTTDLFGADFPDFTGGVSGMVASDHPLASPPTIVVCNEHAKSYAHFLVKLVQKLRASNIRQVAVICHAESYWSELLEVFEASQLPLHVVAQRGEKISPDQPLVILSRPAFVGGQEFDAVILVGLEQGLVPPRVADNPPLAAALEQQMLREIYLAATRARYRVIAALNRNTLPNSLLSEALSHNLISMTPRD